MRRRPCRDGGERERDERVVAGKRQAKKPPGRLVAAHHRDRLQLGEQPALGMTDDDAWSAPSGPDRRVVLADS